MKKGVYKIQGVETQFSGGESATVGEISIHLGTSINSLKQERASVTQLAMVEREWEVIEAEHRQISSIKNELVHLNTPPNTHPGMSPFESNVFDRMAKLLNMEAWIRYCRWYDQFLEEAFEHFVYSDVEEYTLEGVIKDFHHEVESSILKFVREKIKQTDDERELIHLRKDLSRSVATHLRVLQSIIKNIQLIEEQHPELISLKQCGQVLEKLLREQLGRVTGKVLSWKEQQIHIQMLNDALGASSVIHGGEDQEIANQAFAIRLAVLQAKQIGLDTSDEKFEELITENLKFL